MKLLGLNGGTIGSQRTSRRGAAPGIWTPNEQIFYQRQNAWIGDASFDSVSLLLHMNGSNGGTTFTDSSANGLAVTPNGNVQISTTQSKFSGTSAYFDGSGDYLSLPNTPAVALQSSDFTVEAWIRPAANSSTIYSTGNTQGAGAFLFSVSSQGGLQVFGENLSIIPSTHATATLSLNTWHHVALVRSGSSWKAYLNGAEQGSGSKSETYAANSSMYVGARNYSGSLGDYFNGYINDFRITKGVARYTTNFTPSAFPFPDA